MTEKYLYEKVEKVMDKYKYQIDGIGVNYYINYEDYKQEDNKLGINYTITQDAYVNDKINYKNNVPRETYIKYLSLYINYTIFLFYFTTFAVEKITFKC